MKNKLFNRIASALLCGVIILGNGSFLNVPINAEEFQAVKDIDDSSFKSVRTEIISDEKEREDELEDAVTPINLVPLMKQLKYTFLPSTDRNYNDNYELEEQYVLDRSDTVTDINDQGEYSTGWAHAVIAALESNILLTEKRSGTPHAGTLNLSESHLIRYAKSALGTSDPVGNCASDQVKINIAYNNYFMNFPGNAEDAGHTLSNWIGTVYEDSSEASVPDYEYSKVPSNGFSGYHPYNHNKYVLDEMYAVPLSNKNLVKQCIKEYGGAYMAIYYDGQFLSSIDALTAARPYLTNKGAQAKNHAVTVIGWDDNYSQTKFDAGVVPVKKGAWIVKNSAETTTNDNGWMYVSYEEPSLSDCVYFYKAKKYNSDENNYHYDGGNRVGIQLKTGRIAQVYKMKAAIGKYLDDDGVTPKDGAELLKAVQVYTCNEHVDYSLQIYKVKGTSVGSVTNPTYGNALLDEPVKGTFDHAGYNKIELPDPSSDGEAIYANEGDLISFVITFDRDINIAADSSESKSYTVHDKTVTLTNSDDSNTGESFFDNSGRITPLTETYTPWAKLITESVSEIPAGSAIPEHILTDLSKTMEVRLGSDAAITYTIAPDDGIVPTVTFISNNPSVATVSSDGKITGVSEGEADVEVWCEGKKYTIKVTVVKPIDKVVIVPFDESGNEIKQTGSAYILGVFGKYTFKAYEEADYKTNGIAATPLTKAKITSDSVPLFPIDYLNTGSFTTDMKELVLSKCKPDEVYTAKKISVNAIVDKSETHTDDDVECGITVFANNNVETGTVTFYTNSTDPTEIYNKVKVQKDKKLAEPTPPVWEGRIFAGWDKVNQSDQYELIDANKFDFNTKITGDISLYAKWVRRKDFKIVLKDEFVNVDITKPEAISAELYYVDGSKAKDAIIELSVDDSTVADITIDQPFSSVSSDVKATVKGLAPGKTNIQAKVYYTDWKKDAAGVLNLVKTDAKFSATFKVVVTDEAPIEEGDDNLPDVDAEYTVGSFEKLPAYKVTNPVFNLYYATPEADLKFSTKSNYSVKKIELSDELSTKFAVKEQDGKYILIKNPSYASDLQRSDSGETGNVLVYFNHFDKPATKKITVKMEYKAPKISQKGIPVIDPKFTNPITLDLYSAGEKLDLSTVTFEGGKLSEATEDFEFEIVNGEFRIKAINEKTDAKKHQITVKLVCPLWKEEVKTILFVQVKKGTPKVTINPTNVTINGLKKCHPNFVSVKMTIDKKNVHFLPTDKWKISVYNDKTRKYEVSDTFKMDYIDENLYISLNEYKDDTNYFGKYKVRIENILSEYVLKKDINVTIVDEVPDAIVKLTGSYDLVNSKKRELVGTVSLRNIHGSIADVNLNSSDYYATINSDKSFYIKKYSSKVAKEGTAINTKTGTEVYADITLDNGYKIEGVKIKIRPKQTMPSFKVGAMNLKLSDPAKDRKLKVDLQSFVPEGVIISSVKDASVSTVYDAVNVETSKDGDRAGVVVTLKDDTEKRGRVTLKLECYLAGAEVSDEYPKGKPLIIGIPVNIKQ